MSWLREGGGAGYLPGGHVVVVLACSVGSLCVIVSMSILRSVGRRG